MAENRKEKRMYGYYVVSEVDTQALPAESSRVPPASVLTARMVHRMVLRRVPLVGGGGSDRQHGRRAGDTDEIDAVSVAVLVG